MSNTHEPIHLLRQPESAGPLIREGARPVGAAGEWQAPCAPMRQAQLMIQPLPRVLTVRLPGGEITLPFRGVLYLATMVLPGIHEQEFRALWVVGIEDQATDYVVARNHVEHIQKQIARAHQAAAEAGEWRLLNECPEAQALWPSLEAAEAHRLACWKPIQALVEACQAAIQATDYVRAPS